MTAVLVHGVPETPAVWGPLLRELQRDDVITLHLPGFGTAAPAGWGATKEEYADWLISELEAIGEPVDLVGHDWGGALTFRVATTRPDLLRSWVCDVTGMFHERYQWHDLAKIWQTPDAGEKYFADNRALPPETIVELYVAFGMTPDVAAELVAAADEEMARSILALNRSAIQPAMAEMGRDAEAARARPGLALIGGADPFASDNKGSIQVAERMGATVEILEGAGHWWMLDSPAKGAAALERFWAAL